ncbi:MAG: heparan-alpha-glucosaminide N-acetyltransferase domain-containing protein [Prevotellaceae bacterium]|nr:heparan-alpha-glucosaminide N-acetyltransferase domain-containing protein [Prevotellaceae bacterium]MDY3856719.1 heparan-alpha-glucosaminide N-acetyltransferase domain-containing protein [Bacteroidaceae bacterium]
MTQQRQRLLSLDILRGITIAAMIIVNNPGSWSNMYEPLDHAEWSGVTPTDFIFPFFMFIMGVSMCFSLKKYDYKLTSQSFAKVCRRGIGIYLVGIAIGLFSQLARNGAIDITHLRLTGVLARLAFCYFIVALMALTVKTKYFPPIILLILVGYAVLLLCGHGFDQTADNILSKFDLTVLGPHMYHYDAEAAFNFDPEGLLSNIPCIAHVMIGFLVGRMLMRPLSLEDKMLRLLLFGTGAMLLGYLLQYGCPLNKRVWSPTYVLMTCGSGSAMLALLTWMLDVKGKKSWSHIFHAIGVNPLFCYVLGDIYAIGFIAIKLPIHCDDGSLYNVHSAICHYVTNPLFGDGKLSSLMFSIIMLLLVWVVAEILYRKRIYIKL